MASVSQRPGESVESMLKRWKRKVNDAMILADIKKHEEFKSPSQKRREKRKAAEAKRRKQARKQALWEARNSNRK